jgi:MFS superfamily sulfate permease-like transporter
VRDATARIARYVPAVRWLPEYDWRSSLRFDGVAGLAVWAVLMPQSIAYASLAGALPEAGFYAAGAAVLVYALLGTCKELSVGPSSTPAITAASIVGAASVGPAKAPVVLAALALATGLTMLLAGVARLGFIADFISRPVVAGFVTGIAIDVIVSQLPKLLGIPGVNGSTFDKAEAIIRHVTDTQWRPVAIGVQELIALGGGNFAAGLLQGFPTDASLSRSAVANGAGVRSPVYGLVVFVLLVATILWLTPLFDGLPQATLAAVIVGSIYRLIDVRGLRRLYRIDPSGDFALALVALVAVLAFGPLGGIATAVTASLVVLLAKLYRPAVTVLGRAPEGTADEDVRFRNVERHPEYTTFPGLLIARFGGELFFANATYLQRELRRLVSVAETPVREVILDAPAVPRTDTTAAEVLRDIADELAAQGVAFVVARAGFGLRTDLERFGLLDGDGHITLADSVSQGVARFLATP